MKNSNNYFILSFFAMLFIGCKGEFVGFGVKVRENKPIYQLPKLDVHRDSLLEIQSLSVLDRVDYHEINLKDAKVTNEYKNITFTRLLNSINQLPNQAKYNVVYKGSGQNDSIYKSIMDTVFKSKFIDTAMQTINFESIKQNGIYLVVTNGLLHSEGGFVGPSGEQSGVNTRMLGLYEFFNIQNGKVVNYTGVRYARDASFHRKNRNTKYKDVESVFKKLYQISEAQDSLLKKNN